MEKVEKPVLSAIYDYLIQFQENSISALEDFETEKKFQRERINYEKKSGNSLQGYGITATFADGDVFEKAGVNFSNVEGEQLPSAATEKYPELRGAYFKVQGVSIVIHPRNPYVPTVHANLRFFLAETNEKKTLWWFGGGIDLTPYYPFEEDCIHWHHMIKSACLPFGNGVYNDFKQQCDAYFYLPHRKEARGIGGVFFDNLNSWGMSQCFSFIQAIGDVFLPAYIPIVEKRYKTAYAERQIAFQHYRRGRYVEFNLLYDRGTHFGLASQGRTESILISLPPRVSWQYNWQAEPGSPEAVLLSDFLPAKNWV